MAEPFHYSLVQFRGDPVRREALNIGVVVTSADGVARVLIDRGAPRRLSFVWEGFDRRLFSAFVRDLRHLMAETHQLFLGEAVQMVGTAGALSGLSSFAANQFGLTEPRPYNAPSLDRAAFDLYRRMVVESPRASRRTRHLSRAGLRAMIGEILADWARARASGLVIEPRVELQGAITTHTADLVAFDGDNPRLIFFAAPLQGAAAPLIRDALPTVVTDLQRRHGRETRFFAILGDEGAGTALKDSPAAVARSLLSQVPGLRVLGMRELREEFATQGAAV